MYWVFNIVGRDVRGRTNYTCIKFRSPSTCITFFEGLCVRLSTSGSSVDTLGTLEDAGITCVFNFLFLLGDIVTFKI